MDESEFLKILEEEREFFKDIEEMLKNETMAAELRKTKVH